MSLSSSDRIAFSGAILQADSKIAGITAAQAQVATVVAQFQSLDTAHKNLIDPVNALITAYQSELAPLDGNIRTSFVEQDILNAVNKTQNNDFFPNNTAITVPSLSASNNVWTQVPPFALTYAIGKNYTEGYGSQPTEASQINAILTLITSASAQTDIENTTGEHCIDGTCSLPGFTDEASCVTGGGVWDPTQSIVTFPDVVTLKTNIVAAVNALLSTLNAEVAVVPTTDKDPTRSAQNTAALNNLNTVILPAINTWLAYTDFHAYTGSTSCSAFNSTPTGPLGHTKLRGTDLTALQAALNARLTFAATRTSQLQTNLGTIVQSLSDGSITSSTGLYGTRYGFLNLRINSLTGSLSQLTALKNSAGAQTAIISSIGSSKATYQTLLTVTAMKAAGSGTAVINVVDSSFLQAGDIVYLYSDNNPEIMRAVKSAQNGMVVLNDVVSAAYDPSTNGRLYKDLT